MVRTIFSVLLLASPFFFVGGPTVNSSRLVKELWDCGHWLFFAALAGTLWSFAPPKSWSGWAKAILVLTLVGLLGVGIEMIQEGLPGRQASLGDLRYDLAGGLAGVLFAAAVVESSWRRNVLLGVAALIVLGCCARLTQLIYDSWRVTANLPSLADFESSLDLERWQGDADRVLVPMPGGGQGRSLAVRFTTDQFSEIRLQDFPGDWQRFHELKGEIYLPSDGFTLNLKIFDKLHAGNQQSFANRYNGQIRLRKGWNSITVPLASVRHAPVGRDMDLANIRGFSIFVQEEAGRQELVLDNLRLE